MTTIAFRNGIVASDSSAENNGWVAGHSVAKMRRGAIGDVYAVTGNLAESWSAIDLIDKGESPKLSEDCRVVRFHPNGSITVYEGVGSFPVECEYTAFGSGSPVALAAMMMGASAQRAVEIAISLDPYTGGSVVTMSVAVDVGEG